ncbi:hypothetical protein ACLB2K_031773 [Fragaria x ananassa]
MKVHETRSHSHSNPDEEKKVMTRKQKDENKAHEGGHPPKKPKAEDDHNGHANGKPSPAEFEELCSAVKEHLSTEQMREILEVNDQDSSGPDAAVLRRCQDLLFYGPLDKCRICNGKLEFNGIRYSCTGTYSEWASCTLNTRDPPRKQEPTKLPENVEKSPVSDLLKKYQDPSRRPKRDLSTPDKPFTGMLISLMGRLTRSHQYWRQEVDKHGGKVTNHVIGVTCLIVSPAERERGGTNKLAEAMERGIPVVRVPWDKMDPSEEAIESLSAELKLYGKRAVYKDTKLQEKGGKIFERDDILYNCAFSRCDLGQKLNDYCILQLIMVPEDSLNLYYKKGRVGDDPNAEERLEEWKDVDDAVKEFVRIFEEVTGNEFEPWEREKKIQKKPLKFYPIDMDDGVEVRHGGLGLCQLGVSATHCKLQPEVANFMKVLCSQEIYKYALMEMGLDAPDLPMGMLTDVHLKRCEDVLQEFVEKLKSVKESGPESEAIWSDFSQRWFTLLHSTRPFISRNLQIMLQLHWRTAASHLIGDMSGATIDDPLSDRYSKLGCSISPLDKESDDYKMILKYLDKTYEPVKVGDTEYGVCVENIFVVESNACPSLDEIKKLPNKFLLLCGTRSSNLMRHLHKGFLPSICSLPVPGYMGGKAIVFSDAAAEAAKYGYTAVDRPEGFLVLAVASLGEDIIELKSTPEDTKSLEDKKVGVKSIGKKKTDESEHFVWQDDIKVPCGRLVPSDNKDSILEYNEYAVYDPKQTCIRFLVGVKYDEKNAVMDTEERP